MCGLGVSPEGTALAAADTVRVGVGTAQGVVLVRAAATVVAAG